MLKGLTTVFSSIGLLVAAVLTELGVVLPEDSGAAFALVVSSIIMVIQRWRTTTPIFQDEMETMRSVVKNKRLKK